MEGEQVAGLVVQRGLERGRGDDTVEVPGLDRTDGVVDAGESDGVGEVAGREPVVAELDGEAGDRHPDPDLVHPDLAGDVDPDAQVAGQQPDGAHRQCVAGHTEHDRVGELVGPS